MENPNHCLDLSFNEPDYNEYSNLSLIGCLQSQKAINDKAIISVLQSTWNLGPNVHIKTIDRNLVACTFRRAEDRDKIEGMGPWSIKGALLNLKRWSPELTLDEVSFSHCNFWVQIHNLPPNRRNKENLDKLGNFLGCILRHDEEPLFGSLQKFIRIQVSINILKALKPGCFITRENGEKLWIVFKYERLSDFCYGCGMVDHLEAACPLGEQLKTSEKLQFQCFGPWMRVLHKTHMKYQNSTGNPTQGNFPAKGSSTDGAESRVQVDELDRTCHVVHQTPKPVEPDTLKQLAKVISPLRNITNLPPKVFPKFGGVDSHNMGPNLQKISPHPFHFPGLLAHLEPILKHASPREPTVQHEISVANGISSPNSESNINLKRKAQVTQLSPKRMRNNVDTSRNWSLAQQGNYVDNETSSDFMESQENTPTEETMVFAEDRVAVVRRRLIHIKRMARSISRLQNTVQIEDVTPETLVAFPPFSAEEAGLSTPPTQP